MPKNSTAEVISLLKFGRRLEKLIRPRLFHKVRLGYAVWHTLAVAKVPLTSEEILEAMTRGAVFTTAETFGLKNIESALRYHTEQGKLKYRGHRHWTIA